MQLQRILDHFGCEPEELSRKSGITQERILEITSGESTSLQEILSISSALKITVNELASFLGKSGHDLALRITQAGQGSSYISSMAKIKSKLDAIVQLKPLADIPSWLSESIVKGNQIDPSNAASFFRDAFIQSDFERPLLDLPSILRSKCEILIYPLRMKVDGASSYVDNYPIIFLAHRSFQPRMLFTLAHELGHLIFRAGREDTLVVENVPNSARPIVNRGIEVNLAEEKFCNRFASALLLPNKGVAIAIKAIKETSNASSDEISDIEILYLSRIFGVSFEAAGYKCEELQLLPSGGTASLVAYIRKEHGSPEKRAFDAGLPDRPKVQFDGVNLSIVDQVFKGAIDGKFSLTNASEYLGCSIPEILELRKETLH